MCAAVCAVAWLLRSAIPSPCSGLRSCGKSMHRCRALASSGLWRAPVLPAFQSDSVIVPRLVLWTQDDVRLWLEKYGPPAVTRTTWRLHKSKIDPCLQCRHHPRCHCTSCSCFMSLCPSLPVANVKISHFDAGSFTATQTWWKNGTGTGLATCSCRFPPRPAGLMLPGTKAGFSMSSCTCAVARGGVHRRLLLASGVFGISTERRSLAGAVPSGGAPRGARGIGRRRCICVA